MGSKPSSQQSSSSTYTPPPEVLANYKAVTNQAQNVAATPYQSYNGQLVSPVNGQQTGGINAINNTSGIQNGYNAGATGLAAASSQAIDPTQFSAGQVGQYESPYQSDVINATEQELNQQNAQQQQSLQSNAIASGAFGGDRAGIASAALAGQQDIANNATIAGLNNQNYEQALSEFNTQQQTGLSAAQNTAARQLAASQQLGTLGSTAQTEGLNEANAQVNAGTLQQTTQQAQDTAAYNQFLQQQAYPFQTTGWLANIVEGIGSQSGGTSTGTSQTDTSSASGIAGALLGLGSFLARGGRVRARRAVGGGLVAPYSDLYDPSGSNEPLGGGSIVPTSQLQVGHTMPTSSGLGSGQGASASQQGQSMSGIAKGVQGLGNAFENSSLGDSVNDALQDFSLGFARGGIVAPRQRHYDDGGSVSPADLLWASSDPQGTGTLIDPTAGTGAGAAVPQSSAPPTSPAALAQLSAAMGGQGLAPANSNSAYGGLDQFGDSVPTPPVRAAGLGSVPPPSVDAPAPTSSPVAPSSPSGLVASVPTAAGVTADNAAGTANLGNVAASEFDPERAANAIKGIESGGGDYSAVGPQTKGGDRAYGAYQVMGSNIPAWTKQWYGSALTPDQFLQNKPAQDAVFKGQFGSYVKQYGDPISAASTWFTGKPLSAATAGLSDQLGTTDKNYVKQFADAYVSNTPAPAVAAIDSAAARPSGLVGRSPPPAGLAASAYTNSPLTADSPVASTDASPATSPQGIVSPSSHKGLLGLNIPDSVRQGMLAGGFGAMAGTSRNALVNIGQGGLQGVNAYNQARNLESEIGLRSAQAKNVGLETATREAQLPYVVPKEQAGLAETNARTGLLSAQSRQTETEAEKIRRQVDYMHDFLDKQAQEQANKGNAVAAAVDGRGSAPAPAVTPSVAPVTAKSAAPAPPVPGASPGSPSPSAPVGNSSAPATTKQVVPEYEPQHLMDEATQAAAFGNSALSERFRDQAKAIASGEMQVPFTDGTTGIHPAALQAIQQKKQAEASAAVPAAVAQSKAEKDFGDMQKTSMATQQALYRMKEMDEQMKNLPDSGPLAPGSYAEARGNIAKKINTAFAPLGIQPFDPNQVASIEELTKDRFRLGAELSRQIGGKEPGFIVQQAVTANPGAENTRLGYSRIVSGLRQSLLYQKDYNDFLPQYFQEHNSTIGAETTFAKSHPVQQYVERAIASTVDPNDAAALAKNYTNPRAVSMIDSKYGKGVSQTLYRRKFDVSDGVPQ